MSIELVDAVKSARRVAARYDAGEFDQAKQQVLYSERGPRLPLTGLYQEFQRSGQIEKREAVRKLLEALVPASPTREHGELIRTCCDELLEVLGVDQSDGKTGGGTVVVDGEGYWPARLAGKLHTSPGTLNNWAKKAGVATPAQGQKDFKYPLRDVATICRLMSSESGCRKLATRDAAARLVADIEENIRSGNRKTAVTPQ